MLGGKNKQPLGYTIVEVMVVLAVSGVMFLIAAGFIQGKQQSASFKSGVTQMASQIQDVIEQVTDGRYSDIRMNCDARASDNPPYMLQITTASGTVGQGKNSQCVFLGKLISFDTSRNYYVKPMAGRRVGSVAASQQLKATLTNDGTSTSARPTLLPSSFFAKQSIPQGLTATAKVIGTAGTCKFPSPDTSCSFGFILGPADSNVSLVYSGAGIAIQQAQSATVCLNDGSRYAVIDVGSSDNNPLSVNIQLGLKSDPCTS